MENWMLKVAYEKYQWIANLNSEATRTNKELPMTTLYRYHQETHWLPELIKGQLQMALYHPNEFVLLEWK